MAKKVVATLKTGTGKQFTKCIKMVKSEKTGAYMFKESVVPNDALLNTKGTLRDALCIFPAYGPGNREEDLLIRIKTDTFEKNNARDTPCK